MVRVDELKLNTETKKAMVSLYADTKAEITNLQLEDIEGLPAGYTLDAGSDVLTAKKEFAILDSTGTWNW